MLNLLLPIKERVILIWTIVLWHTRRYEWFSSLLIHRMFNKCTIYCIYKLSIFNRHKSLSILDMWIWMWYSCACLNQLSGDALLRGVVTFCPSYQSQKWNWTPPHFYVGGWHMHALWCRTNILGQILCM